MGVFIMDFIRSLFSSVSNFVSGLLANFGLAQYSSMVIAGIAIYFALKLLKGVAKTVVSTIIVIVLFFYLYKSGAFNYITFIIQSFNY